MFVISQLNNEQASMALGENTLEIWNHQGHYQPINYHCYAMNSAAVRSTISNQAKTQHFHSILSLCINILALCLILVSFFIIRMLIAWKKKNDWQPSCQIYHIKCIAIVCAVHASVSAGFLGSGQIRYIDRIKIIRTMRIHCSCAFSSMHRTSFLLLKLMSYFIYVSVAQMFAHFLFLLLVPYTHSHGSGNLLFSVCRWCHVSSKLSLNGKYCWYWGRKDSQYVGLLLICSALDTHTDNHLHARNARELKWIVAFFSSSCGYFYRILQTL